MQHLQLQLGEAPGLGHGEQLVQLEPSRHQLLHDAPGSLPRLLLTIVELLSLVQESDKALTNSNLAVSMVKVGVIPGLLLLAPQLLAEEGLQVVEHLLLLLHSPEAEQGLHLHQSEVSIATS